MAKRIVMGGFLGLALAMALACSSKQEPPSDGGGAGRAGGTGGGGGSGGSGGPSGGGGSEEVRFRCNGTLFCSVTREYCRDVSSPGGNTGSYDGGPINTAHTFSCAPFNDCAARDCSCVPQDVGNPRCRACSEVDGGGTRATCDRI